MAYATAADMKNRYDERRLGQLVLDDGTMATSAQLETDTVLSEMLEDATALIDAFATRGGRYTQAELTALTGSPLKLLKRLTCDLAYGLLVQRRGYTASETDAMAPGFSRAIALLDKLGEGALIFATENAVAAGKPTRTVLSKDIELISDASRFLGDITINPRNNYQNKNLP